jgi:hypothetical protein
MKNGYYYAIFREIKVQCYDPPAGAQIAGSKSYIYTSTAATNQSIKIVDDVVVLKSLYATGDNPGTDPNPQSTNLPQTVPGISGIGTRGDVPGGSSNPAAGGSSTTGFSQGTGSSGAVSVQNNLRSGGSAFAVLVALVLVCVWL